MVIIPTYNEIENVENIILAVMNLPAPQFDVLIVDDNSPDGTAEVVRTLQREFPERLHLLSRSEKNGLGRAYIAGFQWALERDYPYVIEMDADFSHNPADLPRLYSACQDDGADVAVGSRYVCGVNVINWPMRRVLMSYFASKYVRLITGMRINDATAGFVCYRAEVLRRVRLDEVFFYFSVIGMLISVTNFSGSQVMPKSIIVTSRENPAGESSFSRMYRESVLYCAAASLWLPQ